MNTISSSTSNSSSFSTSGTTVSSATSPSSAAFNDDASSGGAAPHTVVDIPSVVPSSAVRAMSEACLEGEKLPGALILCGVLEAAAALWLALFREPHGVFKHHGAVLYSLYYVIVVALLLFGFVEASVGFWVARDLRNRQAAGMNVLLFSVLPLVSLTGLGGVAFPMPK